MTPDVERAFAECSNSDAVRYVEYWGDLTARTEAEFFQRFLFAFCSVHTSWESNVNGYMAIRDFGSWLGDRDKLWTRLKLSGVGLHNNRTRFIGDFADLYWRVPHLFRRRPREPWHLYRDRLEANILGLGHAKTSFALELAFPLEAEVLCMDVHVCRLYGRTDQQLKRGEYQRYEHDWVARARAAELPSFVVKQSWWDQKQSRADSRYWSHVLERQPSGLCEVPRAREHAQ